MKGHLLSVTWSFNKRYLQMPSTLRSSVFESEGAYVRATNVRGKLHAEEMTAQGSILQG